jgi:hypothetical protein
VQPGTYKKEIEVSQSIIWVNAGVVYDVCFWCNTDRNIGSLSVEYNAMVEFYFKQEEIKVPENILKSHDLTATYVNA